MMTFQKPFFMFKKPLHSIERRRLIQLAFWSTAPCLAALPIASAQNASTATPPKSAAPQLNQGKVRDLSWDDLIPGDWKPEKLLEGMNFALLQDGDPRANEAMAKLRELWDKAPAVASLHGQNVRLPGFVAPLERSAKGISEFLLVPYFGACIHSPPPPANQIVHVVSSEPISEKTAQAAVWASGRLEVLRFESALGVSGYRMPQSKVQPYQAKKN
ncbi:MAG: DUF3299 domain-containing protein [Betaproteobacteria bacterium]|jgi:hypothetical protein|nr:DUF3299 domain-containing protein [Pseudomonadota bacterium]NBO95847.1 DUF3299 domain-containing protein [Betaproteobacteria bacterium]HAB47952.1 DUF3299 domain-containing protein [Lautropia sp.]NBP35571.1 DUF3299 domain-containing protein [Betaproteobacteria bacterium]NBQ78933.1 DUF3299 domain-containing protein [Betaproteobacteria bacterium]